MTVPQRTRALPSHPSIEQHKKQAKELLRALRRGDAAALQRMRNALSGRSTLSPVEFSVAVRLSDAQFAIAREHGFESWPKFQRHVRAVAEANQAKIREFLVLATPDPLADHRSGTAEAASDFLARDPALPADDIFASAAIGDADAVARLLEQDAARAVKRGGPHDWQPLQYLCFSRFLREHPGRTAGFVRAARILLENGADPNVAFDSNGETETVLYGAGGVARSPALTRLLLEFGADANDGDLEYHAAETPDLACLMLLVEYGLDLNRTGTALLRKLDFEEPDNVRLLLDAGADPNAGTTVWGKTAIHQAIMRGRSTAIIQLLIDRGADVEARTDKGRTPLALAALYGRTDIMDLLRTRGAASHHSPADELLAALARGDEAQARACLATDPALIASLPPVDLEAITNAAAGGRLAVVRLMLDLGFPISGAGDGAPTPLHQAAWHGHIDVVSLLLERGAPTDVADGHYGGTPLDWARHAAKAGSADPAKQAHIIEMLAAATAGK